MAQQRKNMVVERLQAAVDMLKRDIVRMTADPGDMPVTGCGDNSCVVARPGGMATNGGCRCEAPVLRRALAYFKRLAIFRQETIRELRGQPEPSATAEEERRAVVAFLRWEIATGFDEDSEQYKALDDIACRVEHGAHITHRDNQRIRARVDKSAPAIAELG